jgi:hypothetical protein
MRGKRGADVLSNVKTDIGSTFSETLMKDAV